MRDTQPPITMPEEYGSYQRKLAEIDVIAQQLEARYILASRNLSRGGDSAEVDEAREDYFGILQRRQEIVNAIAAYERECQSRE